MERHYPLVRLKAPRCEPYGYGRAWPHVRFAPKSILERSARHAKRLAEVGCSVRPYYPLYFPAIGIVNGREDSAQILHVDGGAHADAGDLRKNTNLWS